MKKFPIKSPSQWSILKMEHQEKWKFFWHWISSFRFSIIFHFSLGKQEKTPDHKCLFPCSQPCPPFWYEMSWAASWCQRKVQEAIKIMRKCYILSRYRFNGFDNFVSGCCGFTLFCDNLLSFQWTDAVSVMFFTWFTIDFQPERSWMSIV